jgi:hypothetical protein
VSHVAQIVSPSASPADRPGFDRLWHPRGTLCAVCTSRTRGFGWFDPKKPRSKRTYRWFCSLQCQSAFTRKAKKGLKMAEITEEEAMAMPAVMRAVGRKLDDIGWDRTFADLTEYQMHALLVVAIDTFRNEMFEINAEFGGGVPF